MCLVGVLVYIPNVDLQVLGLQNDDIFSGGVALEGLSWDSQVGPPGPSNSHVAQKNRFQVS